MSEARSPADPVGGGWASTLLAVALVVAAHALTLRFPAAARLHPEEALNAVQAALLPHHPPALGVSLQYKDFCGGCTVDAWLGRVAFAALGRTVLAWKLVPLLFTGLLAGAGFRLLRGGVAGWTFVLLLAAPPSQLAGALTTGWGNHLEATALAVASLAAMGPTRGRALVAGLLAGLGVAVSPGAAFVVPAGLVRLGRAHGAPFLLGLVPLAALPPLLVRAVGRDPAMIVSYGAHGGGVGAGLRSLGDPDVLRVLLGAPGSWGGALAALAGVGALVGVGAAVAVRDEPGRRVGLALAAWLVLYLASPFRLAAYPDVLGRPWFGTRYGVALLVLLLLGAARAVGLLAGRRPAWAVLLLATLVPSAVAGRLVALSGPAGGARLAHDPVDAEEWLRQLGTREAAWLATLRCEDDPACDALVAFGRGHEAARRGEPLGPVLAAPGRAVAWGVGAGLPACQVVPVTAASLAACADRLAAAGVPAERVDDAVDGSTFYLPLDAAPPAPGTPVDAGTRALARAAGYELAWGLAAESPVRWPDLSGVDPVLADELAVTVGRRTAWLYGDERQPPPPGLVEATARGAAEGGRVR